jgi:hypothetical protein
MCILIHTAKKELLKRSELQEAMRNNSSGFFIAELLPNKRRTVLRTLSSLEAQHFWDGIPDSSEVVMHFRVPSRGATTIDNVHGWEKGGILFGHNKTLSNLFPSMDKDNWNGTDSEYFFRNVFMPVYKSFGKKAYRNGYFNPAIDHMIRAICGDFNKFLFVMPDNKVLRYGKWEDEDATRPGFYASNASYKEKPEEKSDESQTFLQKLRTFFSR